MRLTEAANPVPSTDRQSPGGGGGQRFLHGFAVLWVVTTFLLVALGGTVTSEGVGLAVPDWPTTFGYNMFTVPWAMWIGRGGVFWEHAHRLLGSVVGMMTIAVALWLWWNQRHRPWLWRLGVASVVLVTVQGIMGGLRVTALSTGLAIVHGVTAQLFLCLAVVITAATGRCWPSGTAAKPQPFGAGLRRLGMALVAVMLIQLVLGASMRHTGARLAIPDFPSAYGGLVPPMHEATIRAAIDEAPYEHFVDYYTPMQVALHYAHRLCAVVVAGVMVWFVTRLVLEAGSDRRLMVPAVALMGMLIFQFSLGAMVIWTGSSGMNNTVATAHQVNGAALLATTILLIARLHALGRSPDRRPHTAAIGIQGATA